jgi:hypothetical protein
VAAFYGNQLRRGDKKKWEQHIKKVIGINILGGGKDDKVSKRYIDGIELIQYSIMSAPEEDLRLIVKRKI